MSNDQNLPKAQDAATEISESELIELISKIEKLPRSQQRTIVRELIDRLGPGIDRLTLGLATAQPQACNVTGQTIKAISLHQPWASLIARGYKQYETRHWATNYRGKIAIHAAKNFIHIPQLLQLLGKKDKSEFPLGAIVAIADLTDCILMDREFINSRSDTEKRCGDWKIGRYAWKLENVRAIDPIPQRGYQGLWNWEMPSE